MDTGIFYFASFKQSEGGRNTGTNAPWGFAPPLSNRVEEAKSDGAKCPRVFTPPLSNQVKEAKSG